jgi:hypothetical protein
MDVLTVSQSSCGGRTPAGDRRSHEMAFLCTETGEEQIGTGKKMSGGAGRLGELGGRAALDRERGPTRSDEGTASSRREALAQAALRSADWPPWRAARAHRGALR